MLKLPSFLSLVSLLQNNPVFFPTHLWSLDNCYAKWKVTFFFKLKVEKFSQSCYGCEELGVLTIFWGHRRSLCSSHGEQRNLLTEAGVIDLHETKNTFSDKVLINSLQPLLVPFKILPFVFEVMKFTENYYKVLIEFHRSSPRVTQNGKKKPAAHNTPRREAALCRIID